MQEILPGVHDWATFHPNIRMEVHSHYVAGPDGGTLLDPMLPEHGTIDLLRRLGPPAQVVLTNRHHLRHAVRCAHCFHCPVLCHEAGVQEVEGRDPDVRVETFAWGDRPAPGVTAHRVLGDWPDESVLHLEAGGGILAFADAVLRTGEDALGFPPDQYLGEDPEAVKRQIRAGVSELLDLPFDHLLFAHGRPWIGGGKDALRAFCQAG